MAQSLFKILLGFRWIMLVFSFGLALALCGLVAVFALKLWKFFLALPAIDEFDAVLKVLGLIDFALIAGLTVMVMLSTFSSFIENQDDADGASWLSSISFGTLKVKLASTITAIGAITLLENLFAEGSLNANNVLLSLAVEVVLLLVLICFAYIDWLGNKRAH